MAPLISALTIIRGDLGSPQCAKGRIEGLKRQRGVSMQGMVERISCVIMDMEPESREWRHYADDAYAIMRTMRSPTQAMIAAGEGKTGLAAWHAMLDVALSEKV